MHEDGISPKGTTKSLGFKAVVATQFLTTFVDNSFRVSVILLAFTFMTDRAAAISSLSTALFLIPYALLSLLAGVLSDRHPKHKVFRFWKLAEVPMVVTGMLGLWSATSQSTWSLVLMLAMLTLLGMQTAFLSPARYGILPEILSEEELSHGNGNLELGSYLGILSGTLSAGFIVKGIEHPWTYGWALLLMPAATMAGAILSFLVPKVPASNPSQPLAAGFDPRFLVRNWKLMAAQPGLIPTVFGLTIFWGVSTLFLLNTPAFGMRYLGYTDSLSNDQLLLAISVGVGLGSWCAGRASMGTIELGLVPIGSGLWFLASLGLALTWLFGTITLESGAVVERTWPAAFFLAFAGFSAGLFVVPLNAYLERYSPPEHRASCIATSNIVTVLGMLAACALNYIASGVGLAPRGIFFIAGILMLATTYIVIKRIPSHFVRFLLYLVTRTIYRLNVVGLENVPKEGPALIVANHTSFADGNLITACFRRFIRFVVYLGHYDVKILRWLGETMDAIPVDPEGSPKQVIQAMRRASEVLSRGELLCIFAEGGITRTGFMMPFRRGFEIILKKAPDVPIIPAYIDGMWGSIFSYHRGRFFWKWPKRIRYPVTIMFGKPLPGSSSAEDVRAAVLELGVECFELRKYTHRPLHREFIYKAKKYARRPGFADTNTPMVSFGQALMRSVIMSRLLKRRLGDDTFVGLLVPPSIAGALANIAVSYLGKVPVNLNYTIGDEVLNRCIRLLEVRQIVASRKFMEKVELHPEAELIYLEDLKPEMRFSDKLFGLAARVLPAIITDHWLLGLGRHGMDDLATIIFSSGSTADPKGVMLTQHNVYSNIESVVQAVDATEQDVLMGVLPFFHSFGYTGTLWLPPMIGAATVYHFNPLDAETVGKMIKQYQATIFLSTATFLRGYIRKCDADDFRSLRLIICGAEKLPMQVADQFEKRFGVRPMEGYGCTELSPAVSTNRPDWVQGSYRQVGHKPGTIGHPMPGQAVKIVDPETWEPLPLGQEGLLLVKGPNVMKGYYKRPDLTAQAIRDGWYATGDIAKLDEDGFITITDRLSRFSKIGGEMVPHGKIEDIIHEILETHERLVAVVGVPDLRKGERLVVIHTPLPMPIDTLWEKLKERLPPLWLPTKASFFEIEEMPVLGSGKVDLKTIKTIALGQKKVSDTFLH